MKTDIFKWRNDDKVLKKLIRETLHQIDIRTYFVKSFKKEPKNKSRKEDAFPKIFDESVQNRFL